MVYNIWHWSVDVGYIHVHVLGLGVFNSNITLIFDAILEI